MTFNRNMYNINRTSAIQLATEYLQALFNRDSSSWELNKHRAEILDLPHNELLVLQSSKELWEKLMSDPKLDFRRRLCLKLHNLQQVDIEHELGLTDGAVSNIFNKETVPLGPRPYKLVVFFNHPHQIINYKEPDEYSYIQSHEYSQIGVASRIGLRELEKERFNVKSIKGYVITDPQELFKKEPYYIDGRWVTTYPEFDYFEFHLNYEPLIDKELRAGILRLFSAARHIITTYLPFRPVKQRSLWIIIPKNESLGSYQGILRELKEYRELTEFHDLN